MKPDRLTNPALGWLTALSFVSGLVANAFGTDWGLAVVHGLMGLALLWFVPWKRVIVVRGLRRGRPGSWISVLLGLFTLLTVAAGMAHSTGWATQIGPLGAMQIHIGAAVATTILLLIHIRARPAPPLNLDRRVVLRLLGVGAGASALWVGTGLTSSNRRFTGSHRVAQPIATQWLDDRSPAMVDAVGVTFVAGPDLRWIDLSVIPQERFEAILDCTSGWYAIVEFNGVRLDSIIEPKDAPTLLVRSATGYRRTFPTRDLNRLWLATEMNGEPLRIDHGAPVRLVAPDRRGFWWVKWVESMELVEAPWWLQSPYPVQ